MKTSIFLILLIFATGYGAPLSSYAQEERHPQTPADGDEVVTSVVLLVTIPVSVLDRQGRFLSELQRENFRIFENRAEQEIAFFETADKPFTVALLLDTSDSA